MGWTYRVMRRKQRGEEGYGIYEVYDGGGCCEGSPSWAESVDDLRWILDAMRAALDKPVLDYPE